MIQELVLLAGSFLGLAAAGAGVAMLATGRHAGETEERAPVGLRAARPSGLRAALATLHPFALDYRLALGVVLATLAALGRAWILVVPSVAVGYVLGDLFMRPALAESVDELSSMLQFIIDFRSGLLSGGVSVPAALELALDAQPEGRFTHARRVPYRQMADPSAREGDARSALGGLIARTTNPLIHITDVLVYLALRATNLRVANQLDLLGDILLQQVQAYRGLVVTELMSSLGEVRLITLITVGAVYLTFVALGSSLVSDVGLSLLAQLVALGGTGAQLLWALSLRRDLEFKLRYL